MTWWCILGSMYDEAYKLICRYKRHKANFIYTVYTLTPSLHYTSSSSSESRSIDRFFFLGNSRMISSVSCSVYIRYITQMYTLIPFFRTLVPNQIAQCVSLWEQQSIVFECFCENKPKLSKQIIEILLNWHVPEAVFWCHHRISSEINLETSSNSFASDSTWSMNHRVNSFNNNSTDSVACMDQYWKQVNTSWACGCIRVGCVGTMRIMAWIRSLEGWVDVRMDKSDGISSCLTIQIQASEYLDSDLKQGETLTLSLKNSSHMLLLKELLHTLGVALYFCCQQLPIIHGFICW